MKIRLTNPLNYFDTDILDSVLPPGGTVRTADNSVQLPAGPELVVELDDERQNEESETNVTWFKNERYPFGFPVNKDAFEEVEK